MPRRRPAEVERAGPGGGDRPAQTQEERQWPPGSGRAEKGDVKTKTLKADEPLHSSAPGRQLEAGRWTLLSSFSEAPSLPSFRFPAAGSGVQQEEFASLLLSSWLISLSGFFCRWT